MRFIRDIQQQVRNFFGISSTEANAFIILLPLMIIVLILFPFYHHFFPDIKQDFSADREQLQNYVAKLKEANHKITDKNQDTIRYISSFDPNTASFTDLITVGMDTITAARLIKYRNTGGTFRFKQDIKKIYGIDNNLFITLEDKISLPSKKIKPESTYVSNTSSKPVSKTELHQPEKEKILSFNINETDSAFLMQIRGIGPVLSSRIIRYRNLLGGFIDTTQYKEVYGLKPDVLEQLYTSAVIEENFTPHTININNSDASQLAQHPYISWTIAKAIISYRVQHGNYTSLDQLSAIKIIDEPTLGKIKIYLSL